MMPFEQILAGARRSGIPLNTTGTIGMRVETSIDVVLDWADARAQAGLPVTVMEFSRTFNLERRLVQSRDE